MRLKLTRWKVYCLMNMNYSEMNRWDSILDPKPCTRPYVTNNGMWAAIPISNSKKLVIIHNGQRIKVSKNYTSARNYIDKQVKNEKSRKTSIQRKKSVRDKNS